MSSPGASSSKKADKKARRAAKVHQKDNGPGPETSGGTATSAPASALEKIQEPVNPSEPSSTSAATSKKADKKARRAAKLKQDGSSIGGATAESTVSSVTVEVNQEKPKQQQIPPGKVFEKKPALSKVERREMQEAQRKVKFEKTQEAHQQPAKKEIKKEKKSTDVKHKPAKSKDTVKTGLFGHLQQKKMLSSISRKAVHPAILRLGIQYAVGVVCGSNARCVALLCALKQVIADYKTPEQKELSRDLFESLKPSIDFLNNCRQLSVSMDSAIKYLRPKIHEIKEDVTEEKAKETLCGAIDKFYEERIMESDHQIAERANKKIMSDDTIVTYGHSSLILEVLKFSWQEGKRFSVIIVDARPKFEGKEMMRKLLKACHGLECSYVLINAISYVMHKATKVFLGAHAVLANGYIMSRVGTSQVALLAKAYNIPLLVCAETYKFSDRVQTDSFVYNELGDTKAIESINNKTGPLSQTTDSRYLQILNLRYDVTPPELVTGLITEAAVIPCSSAPVVIRVKQQYEE